MDPLSALLFSAVVTWVIKHWWEGGEAEYQRALGRESAAIGKAHPDWSARRVNRHAKRATRSYWWNQAVRGFPDMREAREADREAGRARWAEAQVSTLKRRRDAWQRIKDAKAEWDRLHDDDHDDRGPRAEAVDDDVIDAEVVDDSAGRHPCGRCGSTEGTQLRATGDGAQWLCAGCRDKPHREWAGSAAGDTQPAEPSTPAEPAPGPDQPAARPEPAPGAETPPDTHPQPRGGGEPVNPAEPERQPEPATAAAPTEGEPMPPRPPSGHVIPANGTAPARTATGSGEAWTHGQFEQSAASVQAHADAVPPKLESMLGNLRAVDAGRSQVQGVMRAYDLIGAFVGECQRMLAESNRRARPVVRAVENAGGPGEIANMNYYQRV